MSHRTRRTQNQIQREAGPIACFVREQRKKLGYSQEDFSLRVGVGLRFIKDLEQGKKTVRLDKVNQVLNYFGTQVIVGPLVKSEN